MKKQIAILASLIAASGFTAFGQDWVTVQDSGNSLVWDQFTTPGSSHVAPAGDVTIDVLWALTGTSDPLTGTATTGGTAPDAATITSMLSAGGGWTLMENYDSGTGSAALGTVSTTTGGTITKGGSIAAYNSGGSPFEFDESAAVASGSDIEVLFLGYNSAAASWSSATALGVSGMGTVSVGTTVGDPSATSPETLSAFGVSSVPEPATLALAGLGGLSMLFLRRRKA